MAYKHWSQVRKIIKQKKPIIYCGYCQHDLRTWGLVCHDSQTQTNYYGNYFVLVNNERVDYPKPKKKFQHS